jgi:hypothetical protein
VKRERAKRLAKELFDLNREEADKFEVLVKRIERHLLATEVLRLRALQSRFEAECR